jgi:hypothetical protein
MMHALIIGAAMAVGVALWVAAARLLRKLYWAARKEACEAECLRRSQSCTCGRS